MWNCSSLLTKFPFIYLQKKSGRLRKILSIKEKVHEKNGKKEKGCKTLKKLVIEIENKQIKNVKNKQGNERLLKLHEHA